MIFSVFSPEHLNFKGIFGRRSNKHYIGIYLDYYDPHTLFDDLNKVIIEMIEQELEFDILLCGIPKNTAKTIEGKTNYHNTAVITIIRNNRLPDTIETDKYKWLALSPHIEDTNAFFSSVIAPVEWEEIVKLNQLSEQRCSEYWDYIDSQIID